MPIEDLDAIEVALRKRGFKLEDPLLHDCLDCKAAAVRRFTIAGRVGGRDISICLACGRSRSWRSEPGLEQRTEDTAFNLREFLK
jgi:hypothetical protein